MIIFKYGNELPKCNPRRESNEEPTNFGGNGYCFGGRLIRIKFCFLLIVLTILYTPAFGQATALGNNNSNDFEANPGAFAILSVLNIILCIASWRIFKEPLADRTTTYAGENRPTRNSDIYKTLSMFQPLRNRLWRVTLVLLPWVIMETVIFSNFFDKASIFFLAVSLGLTGFVNFWAARFFLERIPIALEDIWESNILSTAKTGGSGVLPEYSIQISLEKSYVSFIRDFENYLNHRMQYACGLLFFVIFFLVPFYWIEADPKIMHSSYSNLYSGVMGFSYFFLGILAWRLWVLSRTISGLSARYNLVPKLGHPDKCGGLSPLGNLCLWSAFMVGIWGILLSAWVVVAQIQDVYVQIAYSMLIVILIIALLCFFYPLWSVHIAMLVGQSEVRRCLWKIGADIHQIESDLLQHTDSLKLDEDKNILNRLDLLRARYKELDSYPVWPFDITVIKKLALTQSVPILTLAGISEPMVKILKIGVDILNQIGPK